MLLATSFASYSPMSYTTVAVLSICGFAYLAGTTREAWATRETCKGIVFLALALLVHGIFVAGASTFGPTPVLKGEVFGGDCVRAEPMPCVHVDRIDVSTGRGYLVNADLPNPVEFDSFYRGDKQVTLQVSIWDARIHWMRTDNTNPPTIVGVPARVNYFAMAEVGVGSDLARRVWQEAKRRGITNESDPFLLLKNHFNRPTLA